MELAASSNRRRLAPNAGDGEDGDDEAADDATAGVEKEEKTSATGAPPPPRRETVLRKDRSDLRAADATGVIVIETTPSAGATDEGRCGGGGKAAKERERTVPLNSPHKQVSP